MTPYTTHDATPRKLHAACGWPLPGNPLFSVVSGMTNCGNHREGPPVAFSTDCYIIGLKKINSGTLLYGRRPYDHTSGSMLFVHEDYLLGHDLHRLLGEYRYFDYEVNEALHLSPREEALILGLYATIQGEYSTNQDQYSRELIVGHLASMLTYAQRFYVRQFRNRALVEGKTITRFNHALAAYYQQGTLQKEGLPSVNMLAQQLDVSPRYLSDSLKSETGKTAMEHLHLFLISEAKHLLKTADKGVAEIAYMLGFEDASYFSRLFKKQVGITPLEFKAN
jgi:AraC family transcriptional activator of pobA